jgi:hypothetical protein
MNRWLAVAGLLAVLLVAAVAFAAQVAAKGVGKVAPVKAKKAVANATLNVATKYVNIAGKNIKLDLTVDVVGVNAAKFGRVVYGTGSLELGNVTYTVKSVTGTLGKNATDLTVYTGNALIRIVYHHGKYYAVVKPLGAAGLKKYSGEATLTVS